MKANPNKIAKGTVKIKKQKLPFVPNAKKSAANISKRLNAKSGSRSQVGFD